MRRRIRSASPCPTSRIPRVSRSAGDRAVTPELRRVGDGRSPVVVVDDFSGRLPAIVDLAVVMVLFPRLAGNYYPGLRRVIHERDEAAVACVRETLDRAA